jgi:hypothetical protein
MTLMRELCAMSPERNNTLYLIHLAFMELANLKSQPMPKDAAQVALILQEALRLDAEFANAIPIASPPWSYRKILSPPASNNTWPAYHLEYPNSLAAQMWNVVRNGRIICHAIILAMMRLELNSTPSDSSPSTVYSHYVLQQMQMDIAAGHLPALSTSRGYQMLWSLSLAGKVSPQGSIGRITAVKSLRTAARTLGMSQADFFADDLEAGNLAKPLDWLFN